MTNTANAFQIHDYSISELDEKLEKARVLKDIDIKQCIAAYKDLLEIYPGWRDVLVELAVLYAEEGELQKAVDTLRTAAESKEDDGRLWAMLGRYYLRAGGGDLRALQAFERADRTGYVTPRFLAEKAECLIGLDCFDEAEALLRKALLMAPNSLSALHTSGALSEVKGDNEEAIRYYRKILTIKTGTPETLYRLSDLGVLTEEEFRQCDPANRIHEKRQLKWKEKATLGYARGIYLAKCEKYDDAFQAYKEANKLFAEHYPFDRQAQIDRTDRCISFFTPEYLRNNKLFSSPYSKPVFIVGMPRSGTTLIEQILSSHSRIAAGGELNHMSRIEFQLTRQAEMLGEHYPQCLQGLEYENVQKFADEYKNYIAKYISEDADFIIDKLPQNFLNIGLIKLIFPNATIIHTKRNPLDTCLSCYIKKFFNAEHLSYTFDLESLGYFYVEYQRLMKHWHALLPGEILDIQYEDLLDNQEDLTRKMLDHIGVEWEDNCLEFYKNERAVKTASLHQVRQPIYKTSAGRWKRYEKHLTPLIKILEDNGALA